MKKQNDTIDYKKEYEKYKKLSQARWIILVALFLGSLISLVAVIVNSNDSDDRETESVIPEVQKGGSRALPKEGSDLLPEN